MVFRELKEKINKFTYGLLLKSYDISKDKRLTQKPAFDIFFNERPGIRHPEITPTLNILRYVHDNSPSIKVATMRLRETIFRRGFEWERKFEAKCKQCDEEYKDVINQCESCGSTDIDIPDKNEFKRADDFFETCTIYDKHKAGKRKLLYLLKEIEDDINIYDDAYLIGIKEYWQDKEGDIKLISLHQIVRGNPVTMRLVADEMGDPGGRWYTCLRHRDVIEEIPDKKCPKCGRKLYEVHYVSVEGGGDQPISYYIGDEVIHVSKYHPSALYGFSPIVTLWQTALTLTNMTEYIYRAYSEAHLPKGVLAMKTSNPDSAYEFWKDVDDKLQKDKHYIPKMFLEGEGNGSGSGMEFVKFMDTLEEMQYIPVRDEIRRTIAALYGVTNIFIGDTSGVGGLNSESTQIDITNMAAESGIAIYNDHIMPEILSWLNIKDWNYVLQSPFEENKQRELNENQSQVQIAQSMLNMGFQVDLGEEDVFEFKYSGEAKKQEQSLPFNMSQQNLEQLPEQNNPEQNQDVEQNIPGMGESEQKMNIQKSRIYIKHPNEAPKGVKIERSPRGSYFYDKVEQKPIPPQRPNEQTLNMDKKRRIETLLQQTNEHYENILEEYKHTKDLNPAHAMSLTTDLHETRNLISSLHRNYQELFNDAPKVEKESPGRNININIQKEKVYVDNPSEAPEGAKVIQGERGGHYYESVERQSTSQKPEITRPKFSEEKLIVDAKKYKTPNEFIQEHFEKKYHQTSPEIANIIEREGFSTEKRGSSRDDVLPIGINTKSHDRDIGLQAEGKQMEVYFPKDFNVKRFETRNDAELYFYHHNPIYANAVIEFSRIDHQTAKDFDVEWNKKPKTDEEYKEQDAKLESILEDGKKKMYVQAQIAQQEALKTAREEGIDAITIDKDVGSFNRVTDNTIIFNPKALKTESQLKDIWNKSRQDNIQKTEQDFDEIKKYAGEKEDIYQMKKFKAELDNIFNEEITKIMNSTDKFSGDDIKNFTKKCLDDAVWKMNVHTKQFLTKAYQSGQDYVAKAVRQSIDFSKVDKEAIDAILNKHVLWESYENLSKSTSEQFNEIITAGFKDPKTFSINNLVNKMREVADSETYRLERIARTETHAAAMKGREVSFQKTDPENLNLYKWAVRHDSRTSDVCKEIDTLVEKEGNGKGVTLQRLNEILKDISMKYGGKNWEYRDYVPHINCRSGLLRAFVN